MPAYTGETPTKAADAQYTYTHNDWTPTVEAVSGDATYTATFTGTVNNYTVTWLDWDGSEIRVDTLAYGEMPVGPTPTRAATSEYTYTFTGWDVDVKKVTGNTVYQALYESERIAYTITWVDENGQLIHKESHYIGDKPVFSGNAPTKASTAQFDYLFAGWMLDGVVYPSNDLKTVDGHATYQAQFQEQLRSYTVTWKNGDTVLKTETLLYGATPDYTGATPVKAPTAQYTFTHEGWT